MITLLSAHANRQAQLHQGPLGVSGASWETNFISHSLAVKHIRPDGEDYRIRVRS